MHLSLLNKKFWTAFTARALLPLRINAKYGDLTSIIYSGTNKLQNDLFSHTINHQNLAKCATGIAKTLYVSLEAIDSNPYFNMQDNLVQSMCKIHIANANVWDNEDPCREYTGTGDLSHIPKHKQGIDIANQQRNDFVEQCDDQLFKDMISIIKANDISISVNTYVSHDARLASEGVGSLLDRLSINTLKLYHTVLLINKRDDDGLADQADKLVGKAGALINQSYMLATQCDELLYDMINGKASYLKFKQYKLYNSAETNSHFKR